MNIEDFSRSLKDLVGKFRGSSGGYGPVIALIFLFFSISSIHLSAFMLSIPKGMRSVVDVGTATSFSMALWAHLAISAVLARIAIGCFSLVLWSFRIGLNFTVLSASMFALPSFLLRVISGKSQFIDVFDEMKLRPVLIDGALSLGRAGSRQGQSSQFSLVLLFSTLFFLISYLGIFLAVQAIVIVLFLFGALIFPLAALQIYGIAKRIADIEGMPVFKEMEEQVDEAVASAKNSAFAIKNLVYIALIIIISASGISGALRLQYLQSQALVILDNGISRSQASLIFAN